MQTCVCSWGIHMLTYNHIQASTVTFVQLYNISLTDGCLTGQVNFFISNSSKYCKTAKVVMEIVMPSYSIVCTMFSISLASLQVINPSLVHSLDFIALQH